MLQPVSIVASAWNENKALQREGEYEKNYVFFFHVNKYRIKNKK